MTARRAVSRMALAVATGLGSGYSPLAPGTAGSTVGVLLFLPLASRPVAVQAAAVVLLFLIGVAASADVAARLGRKDPGIVVVDEIVGMWITLMGLPLVPVVAALGFVLFRLMDVVKPFPARQLESLPSGWGIMVDDVMAGVYAHLTLRAALWLWSRP